MLKSSVRDDNPVMFFADIGLLHAPGEVPDGEHIVALGKAAVLREGKDVSLVSYSKTVHSCVTAAAVLAENGISAEVIDLRTLEASR